MTTSSNKTVEWEDLLESISTGATHAEETNWKIFHYLQQNYKTMGSVMARTLLSAYIKLQVKQASLVNSCMLGMAIKVSKTYSDFQLPKFLDVWGYDACLRKEDRQRETGRDGRQYPSLMERVERALQSYALHHPEEAGGRKQGISSMYAVKVFEKETNGKKRRFVKLVAANGTDMLADSHLFPCRPWEICGKLFDVLTRQSVHGKERVEEIVVSTKRVDEVFHAEVGYVDFIDKQHGHIHVFDAQSLHFVADMTSHQALGITPGCFVHFCPIIINGEHFKYAAITGKMDQYEGRKAFGIYEAKVLYVDTEKQLIRYSIVSPIRETPEGIITQEGYASTAPLTEAERRSITPGRQVRFTLFLKRWKDGDKHNYVAEIF